MATLRLDVLIPGEASLPIGLVAELVAFDARGRPRVDRRFEVVAGETRALEDLAPGAWEVRILAPSGPTVSGEIDLAEGADERLTLRLGPPRASARAGPARQHAPGWRKPAPELRTKSLSPADLFRGDVRADVRFSAGLRVSTMRVPAGPADGEAAALARWSALARTALGDGHPASAVGAREVVVARRSLFDEDVDLAFGGVDSGDRIFALVEYRDTARLHAVPTPFRPGFARQDVKLQAGLGGSGGLSSQVVLLEPTYAGIVAYLSTGAVVTAAELVDDEASDLTEKALFDKGASPLGACAAAYVLVGSRRLDRDAPWHAWVANLGRRFPDVPDGVVLDARLRLLRAETVDALDAVAGLLREAVMRGLPFYAVGIGWLVQSLRHFPNDPFLSEALPLVEAVASALDMREPFTTLQIGDPG